MTSSVITYFGYGSLVNRDTRPEDEIAVNARLSGWRRVWEHRVVSSHQRRGCTSLSVVPDSDCGIDGVLVTIPLDKLPELDSRESGYERLAISVEAFSLEEELSIDTVYLYRSLPVNRCFADEEHPILLSYIDVVMAGYEKRFGETGLSALLHSTTGWHRSVFDDRKNPHYPRHVQLAPEQHKQYGQLLQPFRGSSDQNAT